MLHLPLHEFCPPLRQGRRSFGFIGLLQDVQTSANFWER
jgi:hypothetical protein